MGTSRQTNTGWTYPTTVVNPSPFEWVNPDIIKLSDGLSAQTVQIIFDFFASSKLRGTGYGFNISDNAIVTGLEIRFKSKEDSNALGSRDITMYPYTGTGVEVGATKRSQRSWSTTFTTETWGGVNDSWGKSWTGTEVSGSLFGIALGYSATLGTNDPFYGFVDYVQVRVHYLVTDETLGMSSISSAESVPSPEVRSIYPISNAGGISSEEAFPAVSNEWGLLREPVGIESSELFGVPSVTGEFDTSVFNLTWVVKPRDVIWVVSDNAYDGD